MHTRTFWFAVATVALAIAGWSSRHSRLTEEAALSKADGVVQTLVSSCTQRRRSGISCTDFPVVKFYTASRASYIFQSNVGHSFAKLQPSQSVIVAYDPAAPRSSARILGYGIPGEAAWGISCVVGLIFTVLSALLDRGQRPNNSFKPKPLRGSA